MSSRSYITLTTSASVPSAPTVGDEFYNPTTNVLTKTLVVNGTSLQQVGMLLSGGAVAASNVTATGTVSVTGNITGSNVIVNGTATAGSAVLIVSGNIQTTAANNTANIGNVTNYFNTVHAKATTAQYADVAELYTSDAAYAPGTVVIFGGDHEVTANLVSHSTAIAGVVSENPSHLMNAGCQGTHVVPVALLGRVPCQVRGTISKGDLLVASDRAGVAQRLDPDQYRPGCVIGKSLTAYDSDTVGMIEIAVGVK